MINKNSFLDAYDSLNGSYLTNTAIMIAVASLLGSPAQLSDESPFKSKLMSVFVLSLVLHGLNVIQGVIALLKAPRPVMIF